MNLSAIIEGHDAERIALIDGETTVSYGELRHRVAVLRNHLETSGIASDDRVVVVAGNEPQFVVAILAILAVGAIAAPVSPTSPFLELTRVLDAVEPKLALVGEEGNWLLDPIHDTRVTLLDMSEVIGVESTRPIVERRDDDIALLMPTSGVAAAPKLAMLSHGNLAWMQAALTGDADLGKTPDDTTLGVAPFSHIFGLNLVLLSTLRVGATVVLQRRFDARRGLELVQRHRITIVSGAPQMWQRWAASDGPDDGFSSVRHAISGAAPLSMEVFDAVRDRFGIELAEGYGLTETSPIIAWGLGLPIKPTSVGKPIPGVQVALVDPDGNSVDNGDPGEIVVRGPNVFQGYANAPDATAAALTADGWFWTGDIGIFDEDGYLYLVDRSKDIIIVSGFSVYPSEVESIIKQHAGVQGAVVVGIPDGRTGEAVVAHVVGDVVDSELDTFVKKRLSGYKCPSRYELVDELPLAEDGKLVRRELRS